MVKSIGIKLLILISGILVIFILRNKGGYSDAVDLYSENEVIDTRSGNNEKSNESSEFRISGKEVYRSKKEYNGFPAGQKESCLEGMININEADKDQLVRLPGIGEKLADEIIRYRKNSGGYKVIDEIMKVKGIKEKKYSGIAKYLTVSGKTTLRHCGAR